MRLKLLFEVFLTLILLFSLPSTGHALAQKKLENGMSAGTRTSIGTISISVAETGQAFDIQPQSSQTETMNAIYPSASVIALPEILEMSRLENMSLSLLTVGPAGSTQNRENANPLQSFGWGAWAPQTFNQPWTTSREQGGAENAAQNVAATFGGFNTWTVPSVFISGVSFWQTSGESASFPTIWGRASDATSGNTWQTGGENGGNQIASLSFLQPVRTFDFLFGLSGISTPPVAPQVTPVTQPIPQPTPTTSTPEVPPETDMSMSGDMDMGGDTTDHGSHDIGGDTTDHSSHDMDSDTTDHSSHDMGSDTTDHSSHDMGGDTTDHSSHDMGGDTADHSSHDIGSDTTDHSSHDMGSDTTDHSSHDMGGDTADHSSHDMGSDTTDHSSHDMDSDTTDHSSHDMDSDTTDHSSHDMGSDTTDHSSHDMGGDTADHSSHDMGGDTTDHSSHDMGGDTTDHSPHDMGGDTTDHSSHDMGGDTTDHSSHDMDNGHDHVETTQPVGGLPLEATQAEIDAYVQSITTAPDMDHSMHMDDMGKMMEHGELLDLVPRAEATHIAIRSGDWFDPATWHNGLVPGDDAKVLIPKDISIRYNGESDASLFTLRVDGELSFATDMNTKMLIDTFVVDSSGRLEIGTKDNPVQSAFDTKIIFANNGDIDVSWDPTLLSRGLISHGQVDIHGEEKTEFLKVADAPMAGDTQIILSEIPENWSVGDTIVITGTHKQGWQWDGAKMAHFESQDEEVTITAIDGNTITIGEPLKFDHDTPRDDLAAYVANMTRNITFTSEDGEASALHHRGHVMFMHNDDVDVRYAAFDDLGRTDKSRPAGDLDYFDTIEADTNIKSRYSFHFHKTGTEIDNDPAYAIGNAVSGSPGWGFVHHSSHADFVKNVAFDVFGAAFAAEDGDETGIWRENLAIRSEGIGAGGAPMVKRGDDVARDDSGRTGDGFFFAGRLVEVMDNIAANTTHGFVWLTRGPRTENSVENLEHFDMAIGVDSVSPSKAPIQEFSGNEAFGTEHGLIVIKSSPNQGHDFRTVIDDFVNWETKNGINLTYTSHYTVKDIDILATQTDEWYGRPQTGFIFGTNTIDMVAKGISIEGFETAVKFNNHFTMAIEDKDVGYVLIDLNLLNNENDFSNFDPNRHSIMSSDDLIADNLAFTLNEPGQLTLYSTLSLSGTKTDSIGTTERGVGADVHKLYLRTYIEQEGYWETEDGGILVLVPDAVTDRVTGEILKFQHIVEIENDEYWLSRNSFSNGSLPTDNQAPTSSDDQASTSANTSVVIDVLANDVDLDGEILMIDSFENPANGRAIILDNGQLEYTPDHDFIGRETFTYWATDAYGFRSAATITVDIWDT